MKKIVALVALVLLPAACEEEELGEADLVETLSEDFCAQVFSCACAEPGYSSREACVVEEHERLDDAVDEARDAGLVYDATCATRRHDELRALGCRYVPLDEPDDATCERPCAVYHGTARVGEPCEPIEGGFSTCAQGLDCDAVDFEADIWACEDPCVDEGLPLGSDCVDEEGEVHEIEACARGLYCFADTELCERSRGAGQPCGSNEQCDDGLWCSRVSAGGEEGDYDGVCAQRTENGTACDGDNACRSDFCEDHVCATAPHEHEACDERCADGLECTRNEDAQTDLDPDRICAREDALVCNESYRPQL